MLMSLCKSRISIQRQTSELFTPQAAAASISVYRNPPVNATIQVERTGNVAGVFTIEGSIVEYDANNEPSTVSVTDTLTFVEYQKVGVTVKEFTYVSKVYCSAPLVSAGSVITCTFVGNDGGTIAGNRSITSDYPAQFVRTKHTDFPIDRLGSFEKEKPDLLLPYTTSFTPQPADIVINDFTDEKFIVEGTPLIEQVGISQYWRLSLARDKNL